MPTLHSLVQDANFCLGFCYATVNEGRVEGKKLLWPIEKPTKVKDI